MALQTTGQISLSNVAGEKSVSLSNVSLVSLSTTSINTDSCNPTNPNNGAPHSIAEFYGYDHSCVTPPAGLNEFIIFGFYRFDFEACEINSKGEPVVVYSDCPMLGRGCRLFIDSAGESSFNGDDFWFYDQSSNSALIIDAGGTIQSATGCE